MSLQRELIKNNREKFDVMVIDAFSGDSIPQHLLTLEAFKLYFKHLSPNGVLAIHISNSHLNLSPVVKAAASALQQESVYVKTVAKESGEHDTEWALLTNNKSLLNNPVFKAYKSVWPTSAKHAETLWTDNYSNLFSVLK
jgi:spermidine synthase